MASLEHTRTQRVQIRIAPALQNTTVSGFVVNRARDAASHLIREHGRLELDARDWGKHQNPWGQVRRRRRLDAQNADQTQNGLAA